MPTVEKVFPLNTAQLRNLRNWSEEECAEIVFPIVLTPVEALGPDEVRRAFHRLLARHEALRSRLAPCAEAGWVQEVLTPEEATDAVVEFVSVATADDVRRQGQAPPMPVRPTRLALRAVACVHEGVVRLLRISVSHVFADAVGARVTENDLRAILATGGPSVPNPRQASEFALGPDHPTVRANTQRWKDLLADAARACTYAPDRRERYEPVQHAVVPLTAVDAQDLDAAGRRLRRPMSAVWVALGSVLVQLLTGQCRQVFRSTYGNRLRPGDLAAVAQLAQATYLPIAGSPDDTFRNRLETITRTTLPTYRWGEYGANELLDWLNAPENCRGTVFRPAFEVNYEPPLPGGQADQPAEPVGAQEYETRARIDPLAGKADLAISVTHEPGPLLMVRARRPLARQRGATRLARDLLAMARSLTEAPDQPIAEVGTVTRLPALAGLTRHHSGTLVDLASTREMILSVPGVRDCLLTSDDHDGRTRLHARVHGRVGTRDELLSQLRLRQCWRAGCVVPDSVLLVE